MSEMVKLVARAIDEAAGLSAWQKVRGSGMFPSTDEIARAAIAAMRKPTEAMKYKGGKIEAGAVEWNGQDPINEDAAAEVWRAMIDEALK